MIYSLKPLFIYLLLDFYAAPQFILCLKQAILAPAPLRHPSLKAHILLIGQSSPCWCAKWNMKATVTELEK